MPTSTPTDVVFKSIPVTQIKPNPWDRAVFDPAALAALADSIKVVGVREPLLVRDMGDGNYQIASGQRRWLAAQQAGVTELPCLVEPLKDREVQDLNLIANLQREDIPVLEQARMIQARLKEGDLRQIELARRIGRSKAWISDLLGFLELPEDVLKKFSALNFSFRALQMLMRLNRDQQLLIAKEVLEDGLKPEKVEKRCRQLRQGASSVPPHVRSTDFFTAEPDPLASLWSPLIQGGELGTQGSWEVKYGHRKLFGETGPEMGGWQFWITASTSLPRTELAAWFQKMADHLKPEEKEVDETEELAKKYIRESGMDIGALIEGQKNLRLPKNKEEDAELEALAAQGPGPVYAWIYGKDNPFARQMEHAKWSDWGISDPTQGVQQLVESLRIMQQE